MSGSEQGWVGPVVKATLATVIGGVILYAILPATAPQPAPPQIVLPDDPARAWDHVKDSCDRELLESYRYQVGSRSPVYDKLAEKRIALIDRNDPGGPCYTAATGNDVEPAPESEPAPEFSTTTDCDTSFSDECAARVGCSWNFIDSRCEAASLNSDVAN